MRFGMFPFNLHHRDPASECSSSNILGVWFGMLFGSSRSASTVEILFPNAQAPSPWGCDLACVWACFSSASTIEIMLPNAQAPAPWGVDLACVLVRSLLTSTIGMMFPNAFGMSPFNLHHNDPASKRSSSIILGLWFGMLFWHVAFQPPPRRSCFRTLKLQHLGVGGSASFLACFLSRSTTWILFPNAQAPASWVCGLA